MTHIPFKTLNFPLDSVSLHSVLLKGIAFVGNVFLLND